MRTSFLDRALTRGLAAGDAERLHRVAGIAAGHGKRLWLVGGPVRDLLAGRAMNDLDLAVDGGVQSIGREIAREFDGSLRWNPRFSTARIAFSGGHLDLARTRTETYTTPGALPIVRAGRIEQDLARRDFSVNAMALEILAQRTGELMDPFDGRTDLRSRALRVLHEGSFSDDPTRAFRAARFAARFGFRLEEQTRRQLVRMVERGEHEELTGERVARELRLALSEERPSAALAGFVRWRLTTAWGAASDPSLTGLRFLRYANRRLERLGPHADQRIDLRLAVAFHDLPLARRERIAQRLRLRRDERKMLLTAPSLTRALLERVGRASGRLAVDRVCSDAPRPGLLLAGLLADARTFAKMDRWWRSARRARLEIDGDDLRSAGVPEGPPVARGLRAAREALLAGRAGSRETQLKIALRAARRT